jgi:hypothetical protein
MTEPSKALPLTPSHQVPDSDGEGGGAGGDRAEPEPALRMRDMFRDALQEHRATIRQNAEEGKPPPILDMLGGKLGIVESVLPVAVFSVVYGVTKDLRTAIIAALIPSALTTGYRLVRRETLMSAFSGLLGVGIGALVAWLTGGASWFFLPGAVKNVAFAIGILISIVVRWPVIGVFLGFVLGEDTAWRHVEARRRAYVLATWVWFGMFAVRAAIQIPLLLADQAVKLGFVNLVLGLPLYGTVLLLTWLIVRRVPVVKHHGEDGGTHEGAHPDDDDDEHREEPGVAPEGHARDTSAPA